MTSGGMSSLVDVEPSSLKADTADTALPLPHRLNAVNNMIKSSAAIISPVLGVFLKRITGSWHALFFLTAGFHALSALVYGVWAQVEPAPAFREKQD